MSGLAYTPNVANEATAEFDLTLECPGRWILRGHTLPDKGLWYGRQAHAMSYACHRAAGYQTIIVRLHNRWQRLSLKSE